MLGISHVAEGKEVDGVKRERWRESRAGGVKSIWKTHSRGSAEEKAAGETRGAGPDLRAL